MQTAVNSRLPNNEAYFVCYDECITSVRAVCVCVVVVRVNRYGSLPIEGIQG